MLAWLRWVHWTARPLLALRAGPDALTALGLLLAIAVPFVVGQGGRWPLLGAALVGLSGLVDSLDGAVAVLTGRTTRWGALLDAAADRLSDAAFGAGLWALGAPGVLVAAAVGIGFLHEYIRARAAALGLPDVGAVTVAERPTRVVGAGMFLLAAGLYPGAATGWAIAGAIFGVGTGAVGLGQLLVVVRRRLLG